MKSKSLSKPESTGNTREEINSKCEFEFEDVKIITDVILKVQLRKIITANINEEGYIYSTKYLQ